jgi:hypothetical protein
MWNYQFVEMPDSTEANAAIARLNGTSLARIIHQPKKPTEEGALGSRMILKTAVLQVRHNPKTNASGCPGTGPTGLMAVIGHTASSISPHKIRTRHDLNTLVLGACTHCQCANVVWSDLAAPSGLQHALHP